MNPIISIILPTYNGSQSITRAITSILNQEYQNWELLVVSDGSTDETKSIVAKFSETDQRIVLIENTDNKGIQKSLNEGLLQARGEYIARIDDDDEWVDCMKLSAQISFFENHTDHLLLGTNAMVVDKDGTVLSVNKMPSTDTAIRSSMLSKNCFLHSTILVKKSAIEKVGGYSEEKQYLHAEDYELWLRIGAIGKMANLSMLSTNLTAHNNSLTSRNRVLQARNVLRSSYVYRKKYPRFFAGYIVGIVRLMFFCLLNILPLPSSLWYAIQRTYRSA
ncbi:MAG TPA: glycosyltransferase [Candidatus Paceibacterota bacterium]